MASLDQEFANLQSEIARASIKVSKNMKLIKEIEEQINIAEENFQTEVNVRESAFSENQAVKAQMSRVIGEYEDLKIAQNLAKDEVDGMIGEIHRQEEQANIFSATSKAFEQDIEDITERLFALRKTLALVKEEKRSLADLEQEHLQRLEEQGVEKARLLKEREELHLLLEETKQAVQAEKEREKENYSMLGTAKESHEQARLCMVETDRDLQELIEEHKRAIESTNSELDALTEQCEALATEESGRKSVFVKKKRNLEELSEKLDFAVKNNESVNDAIAILEEEIAALGSEIKGKEEERAFIMECDEELAISISTLKGELDTCTSSSTEAQNVIEQRGYFENIKSMETQVAAIRSENAQLEEGIQDARLKVETPEFLAKQAELNNLSAKVAKAKASISSLQNERKSLIERRKASEEERDRKRARSTELQEEEEAYKKAASDGNEFPEIKLVEAMKEIEDYSSKLPGLKAAGAEAEKLNELFASECLSMTQTIEAKEMEMARLKKEITALEQNKPILESDLRREQADKLKQELDLLEEAVRVKEAELKEESVKSRAYLPNSSTRLEAIQKELAALERSLELTDGIVLQETLQAIPTAEHHEAA